MAQSLSKIYIHLIFHIKTNSVTIQPKEREILHAYIVGAINNLGSSALRVGGTNDHVHILCTLPKDTLLPEFVRKIKYSSHNFLKQQTPFYRGFAWQNGYGVFSVSSSVVERVKTYIDNQMSHHHKMSFKDEYKKFLDEYKVEYNDKYLFCD